MPEGHHHQLVEKMRRFLRLDSLHPVARVLIVSVVGGIILLLGIIMIVTPGPAIVFIPMGLMVLGIEFAWAVSVLGKMTIWHQKFRAKRVARKSSADGSPPYPSQSEGAPPAERE